MWDGYVHALSIYLNSMGGMRVMGGELNAMVLEYGWKRQLFIDFHIGYVWLYDRVVGI